MYAEVAKRVFPGVASRFGVEAEKNEQNLALGVNRMKIRRVWNGLRSFFWGARLDFSGRAALGDSPNAPFHKR